MRNRSSVACVIEDQTINSPIGDVVRSLVELAQGPESELRNSTEEVLVDTEVDGFRYLLVRMPNPGRNRVQLSPREQEIVRMVAKGHPNKVIADVLNISSWTVCTHLRRIFAKLGVGSRAAMVAQLLELGLLGSEHRGQFSVKEGL
jgi:two-component system nitrate/nitrite response regulator NarL